LTQNASPESQSDFLEAKRVLEKQSANSSKDFYRVDTFVSLSVRPSICVIIYVEIIGN